MYCTCLILLLLSLSANSKSHSNSFNYFQLTPQSHYLVMYMSSNDDQTVKVNFKIDFHSTEFFISNQLANAELFLDKQLKKSIKGKMKIVSKIIHKDVHQNQNYQGIIGFKQNSEFFEGIKKVLQLENYKLWFKIQNNKIELIRQKCSKMIFLPFQIQLQYAGTIQKVQIEQLSLLLSLKAHKLLKLINKKETPFEISPEQMENNIKLQLVNEVHIVELKSLISRNCNKISGSRNYECNMRGRKDQQDGLGALVFQFNPIICPFHSAAIELSQEEIVDHKGYYWIHIILIFINCSIILAFKFRISIGLKIASYLGFNKYTRTH